MGKPVVSGSLLELGPVIRMFGASGGKVVLPVKRLRRGLRRRVAGWIAPEPALNQSLGTAFYSQQPTCQVSSLYYLLAKFLGERADGHYVEVGGYDGLFASNTWGLAQRGWHGLLIEPVPHLADACRRNYAHLERIHVLQVAVGDSNKEIVLQLAGTLTTANTEAYSEYGNVEWAKDALTSKRISVECCTLNQVLVEQNVPQGFDLLNVDVEGFETEVFSGFDLSAWKPKMLIVELADTHPDLTATEGKDARLGRKLSQAGYVISYKDSINTVFVREDVWESAFGMASQNP